MINCDSQAAIWAINSTVIKNGTTLEATMALKTLVESNEISLRRVPAHCVYEGNELADQLAKRGSNNYRATRIKLPMPRCVCYAALRRKTIVSWIESFKLNPPKMFNILWRDKFSKDLIRMNKRELWAATQILTGHARLNYHHSKLNRSVQPLCPLCEAEYDTVPHLLAKCPTIWQLRVEYFDTHYTTVTEIVDIYNMGRIIGYVNRTNRLEFWDTEAMFHDKSSDPETVFYCYMISTWVVSTWDWTPLPCAQALADNCWHFLASRYIWGVKGTFFHQLGFWKSIPNLVVDLRLREQNKPSGVLRHFSYVSWQVERSRNSILLLYDLDLSS